MMVLGLQGSPREKGNTAFLLSVFMREAKKLGAQTHVIEVDKKNIIPCREYTVCSKKGFCPIDDDMKNEIYPLLRKADVIVAATPIFFYHTTAQLKALIDRCQVFWSRKYLLKLNDPGQKFRRGFLLALGASKGENLFDGVHLTAKYFFDAVGAGYDGSLTYRQIADSGDMEKHPTVLKDVKEAVSTLLQPFLGKKKVLFACRENACCSQIASAFTQLFAGDKIEVVSGGSSPASQINPVMVEAMKEKGIDMAFRRPQSIDAAVLAGKPDIIITMGCGEECAFISDVIRQEWNIPDPSGKPVEFMRNVRDIIEKKVIQMI
ncbi:MAG: NAD(P)H-dependent oxidoreductase [Proteobacteria bacterium]|nr:NAD(P)H-dependent oxidoreductase [Pseudomonadota bacterium]NQT09706.1 NAD(P)H-dependent oxidoreductase [Desulfobacteraceae bacterium]